MNKRRHSPWIWIPSLCVSGEVPSVVVTYIALLMFIQFGAGMAVSSLLAGLLFLPWVMKSYLRSKVRNAGYFKRHIHVVEGCIFVLLSSMTLYMSRCVPRVWVLFLVLFVICFFCAWHELLARMYYNRMLGPRQQAIFNKTKIFASQSSAVITYGVLIIVVGLAEVIFRSMRKAWVMEGWLVTGGFMFFMMLNWIVLQNPRIHNPYRYESLLHAFKNEMHVIDRIRQKEYSFAVIAALFFLLLPQALMFNTRVFFLLAPVADGGLGCSIQDVGFAQGTIGVLAYTVGITLGRMLIGRYGYTRMFWYMAVLLTLSPLCYVYMSQRPCVGDVMTLCSMTFMAQFMFGFGLNVAMHIVHYISNDRYRNTVNYLYVPLVAGAMIVPMCLSGWMVETVGFRHFFILDAVMAPVSWVVAAVLKIRGRLSVLDGVGKTMGA